MSDHPSMFALDQLALGDGSPEVKVHVDACLHCQAHVKQVTTPVEFPPSIRVRAMKEKRRTFDWRWLAAGLATAAAAVVVGVSMPAQDGTRPKGAGPALELFVKRGEAVTLWDARSPVVAGDRLLLRVDAAGYTHTRVLAGDAVLFEGALPADRSTPLPVSFKVDSAEGAEHLRIELSGGGRPGWATELELPKETP